MPTLREVLPDANVLIALEPEELGGILLHVLDTRQQPRAQFHPHNFESEIYGSYHSIYPREKQNEVLAAIRVAFAWLESQVLIVSAGGLHRPLTGSRR